MPTVSPEQMLKITKEYAANIAKAMSSYVAVGLPTEKIGSKVYGDGDTVIGVGAVHEYGAAGMPRRSFLREPFNNHADDLEKETIQQFKDVIERGKKAETALGLIGVAAVNISKDAFLTSGDGKWAANSAATVAQKGSSRPLVDTGTLRNSITHIVRSE